MTGETTLRLFIIEDSINDASAYITALRGNGFSVREHILGESEDIKESLLAHEPDLIIINHSNPITSLANLHAIINEANISVGIIMVCAKPDHISVAEALDEGARDRVINTELEHLVAVVKREFDHQSLLNKHQLMKKRYKESEARAKVLMENSRDAIAYIHQGMHVYANQAYMELFGFEHFDDVEGLPIMDMVAPEKQEDFKQFLRTLNTKNGQILQLEIELKGVDGQSFNGHIEFREATIEGEPCTQILARQQVDTSALEEQINQLSRLDPLTGLLNRQAFLEEFEKAIDNVGKKNQHYSLLQISIDEFKKIQEKIGLVGSDQVIAETANIIKEKLDQEDLAGRNEGSKYLLLSKASTQSEIAARAELIYSAVSDHICDVAGKSINVKCHIGATIIDDSSLDVNEVMSRAEKALKAVSGSDNERLNIYEPKEGEMSQKQIDAAWVKKLNSALKENRFKLLYQPIVQLDGGENERYEVFMEMVDEENQRVPTSDFMPAAERTQMSKVLDRWVIENALDSLVKRAETNPNTVFFVKLTGGSLEDLELFRWISEKIKGHQIEKWRLIFEVKEEAVVSHLKQAQAFATLLKNIHCGFAIDDFGKGPDPFKLVELVPAQYLKFHKDFAKDLSTNNENQKTLQEITEKAKTLKKHTIIQHVEDAATLSVLWTIGANYTQGNFFQGPGHEIDYDFSSGIG